MRNRTAVRIALAAIAGSWAGPAAAQTVTVARSAALAMEVRASPAWCSNQPVFDLVGPSAEVFTAAELAALVRRLGTDVVARQCPDAQVIRLSGSIRGSRSGPVWHATADAASGWTLHPEVPAVADLDQPPPAAAPAQPAPATTPPATAPDGRPVPLDAASRPGVVAALGALPGRWVPARRCWVATDRSSGTPVTACLTMTRAWSVSTAGGTQVQLLLQGSGTADCHACAGLSAFAVLASDNAGWKVVVKPRPFTDGQYGKPTRPDDMAFVRLGADRWGWIQSTSSMGQGVVEGGHQVFMRRGAAMASAGQLPGAAGNGGACPAFGPREPGPCAEEVGYDITVVPDASDPAAAAYPLLMHAVGKRGGPLDVRATAAFDEARFSYVPPDNWP